MKVNIKNIRTLYDKLKPEVERATGYSLPEDGQESPFIFKLATGKLAATTFGMCKGAFGGMRSGEPVLIKAEIKISNVGEPSEESARTTLAHELVHLIEYIYFTKQSVSGRNPHGEWFLQMANKINAALGTQITAYTSDERLADRLKAAPKARVIAVGVRPIATGARGNVYFYKPSGPASEKAMIAKLQGNPWLSLRYVGHCVYETDNMDVKTATGRRTLTNMLCKAAYTEDEFKKRSAALGIRPAPGYGAADEERMLECFE
jgi:predicted SprT family Zn-dependent metalloprotease